MRCTLIIKAVQRARRVTRRMRRRREDDGLQDFGTKFGNIMKKTLQV